MITSEHDCQDLTANSMPPSLDIDWHLLGSHFLSFLERKEPTVFFESFIKKLKVKERSTNHWEKRIKSLDLIFSVMKFKAVSWKIWDSERTLPVPSLWTPFSLWWSLKHRENLAFSQSSFKIWDSRRTLPVPSLWTPFSLWWSLKNTKKNCFFTEQFHEKYEILGGHCQCQVSEPHFLFILTDSHLEPVFFPKFSFCTLRTFKKPSH